MPVIKQYIEGQGWVPMVAGVPGEPGPQGPTGPQGATGPQGTPTTVNGKTGASVTLTATDVGAYSTSEVDTAIAGAKAYTDTALTTAEGYVDTAISNEVTRANAAYIANTEKGASNGVATLDANGQIPSSQLSSLAITDTTVVSSEAAMLALDAQTGDIAVRTDIQKSYILQTSPASTLSNWIELAAQSNLITSVDGQVGTVSLANNYDAKGAASTALTTAEAYTDTAISNEVTRANAAYDTKGAADAVQIVNSTTQPSGNPKWWYNPNASVVPSDTTFTASSPITTTVSGSNVSFGLDTESLDARNINYAMVGRRFASGYWYTLDYGYNTAAAGIANTCQYVPVYVSHTITVSKLGAYVTTYNTSSTIKIGIYDTTTTGLEKPNNLLIGTANIATTANGFVSADVTATTLTRGWYWLAIAYTSTNAAALAGLITNSPVPLLPAGTTSSTPPPNNNTGYYQGITGGNLPTTASTTGLALTAPSPKAYFFV